MDCSYTRSRPDALLSMRPIDWPVYNGVPRRLDISTAQGVIRDFATAVRPRITSLYSRALACGSATPVLARSSRTRMS